MTASRFPLLRQKFFQPGTNLPLVNGVVTTWKAGTTGDSNLQTTWSNSEQTAENPNPLTLDANGEADIYGGPDAYHVLVQDSMGNTIEDQDNVFSGTPDGVETLVNSLADLRALSFGSFTYVVSEYREVPGDGGGGEWDWVATSSAADDGVLIISPDSAPPTGRFQRRYSGMVDVRWGGILDNGTPIDTLLPPFLNAVGTRTIYFPKTNTGTGIYAFANIYTFPSGTSLFVDAGAYFSVVNASSLSLQFCTLFKGPTRLFSLAGSAVAVCPQNQDVLPEWYGAAGDGTSDDYAPIISMLNLNPPSINFGSEIGYASSVDPGFVEFNIPIIRANSNVFLLGNLSTVYLAKGINAASGTFVNLTVTGVGFGSWHSYSPAVTPTGGSGYSNNISAKYSVFPKTLFLVFSGSGAYSTAPTSFNVTLPPGITLKASDGANTGTLTITSFSGFTTFLPVFVVQNVGLTSIDLHFGALPASAFTIGGSLTMETT